MSTLSYKELQKTLKSLRDTGLILNCKLNEKKEVLEKELERLNNEILYCDNTIEIDQLITSIDQFYFGLGEIVSYDYDEYGYYSVVLEIGGVQTKHTNKNHYRLVEEVHSYCWKTIDRMEKKLTLMTKHQETEDIFYVGAYGSLYISTEGNMIATGLFMELVIDNPSEYKIHKDYDHDFLGLTSDIMFTKNMRTLKAA